MVSATQRISKDDNRPEDDIRPEGEEEKENKKINFDDFIFSHLGEMGKYQAIQLLLVCLPTIFCSMHTFSWTFAGVQIPHRCALDGEQTYGSYWNDVSQQINITTECYEKSGGAMDPAAKNASCLYQQCETKDGTECSSFVYDNSLVSQSAIGRWDIVCDNAWIMAFIQSAYYAGQIAGSVALGVFGDRIGRKKCFFIAIAVQNICGFVQSVAPTWWIYALFRAGTGFSDSGVFSVATVIGMELVGPRYRKLAIILVGVSYALGQCILGGVAVGIRDYQWLHVVIAAPAIIFLSYWWLVPESARWLFSVGRFNEADHVLQKAARTNGVTLPDEWWTQMKGEEKRKEQATPLKQHQYGSLDLLKRPELRKRTLVVLYLWPVVSMVYCGLSMKADILGGDLYVNFIAGGLIDVLALVLVCLAIDRIGRRYLVAIGFVFAGICLLSNLLITDTTPRWISLMQLLVSRGSSIATFSGIVTLSPELFPTVLRNSAMGIFTAVGGVGAIASSFIVMWLVERFGKVYMLVPFGTLAILAAVLVLIFLPETMGKSLPETIEEIESSLPNAEVKLETETKIEEGVRDN